MKGVESVIAIILILMIVIALAALAYTWFTGIFSSLTQTTSTAITTTQGSLAIQFSLESAYYVAGPPIVIRTLIRNTGTQPIEQSTVAAYVNDQLGTHSVSGALSPGAANIIPVTPPAGWVCGVCTNHLCGSSIMTVTVGTGLQQKKPISC